MYTNLRVVHCYRLGLLSLLIRLATWCKWSHTALQFDYKGTTYIIDAQKEGVVMRSKGAWKKKFKYKTLVQIPPEEFNQREVIKKAIGYLGTPYDKFSLLVRQPVELATNIWLEDGDTDDKLYCSELLAECFGAESAEKMSPKAFKKWCDTKNFKNENI